MNIRKNDCWSDETRFIDSQFFVSLILLFSQSIIFPCSISNELVPNVFFYREECSSKGGVNADTCASGFGVCCTCK